MRYVKQNALQGRDEELTCWEDYRRLAVDWRDQVANVRVHNRTKERPIDRFRKEQGLLRPLPAAPFDTDEIVSVVVNSHARVHFDGNRYSVSAELARKTALVRANADEIRVLYQQRQWACHPRSYDRGQLICHADHQLDALKKRRRVRAAEVEDQFDALGEEAHKFHLELRRRPIRTSVHLRRLLMLVRVYGRQDVIAAIVRALEYQTYDAAYVETILLQERHRRDLPSPLPPRPKRQELIDEIDLQEPDPGIYDRFCNPADEEENH